MYDDNISNKKAGFFEDMEGNRSSTRLITFIAAMTKTLFFGHPLFTCCNLTFVKRKLRIRLKEIKFRLDVFWKMYDKVFSFAYSHILMVKASIK